MTRRGPSCMQAVAVEFDFVQPLAALRRGVDQLRELRPDPLPIATYQKEFNHAVPPP